QAFAAVEQLGASAALLRRDRVVANDRNAAGDSAGDDDATGDSGDAESRAGNARSATVAVRSRDAASRTRDCSSGPGSASHGGSTETKVRAADRARGSCQDDATVAAATRTAADNDPADDAERDHNRGTAGRAVAVPAAAVAHHPQQRADPGEPEQQPRRALLH